MTDKHKYNEMFNNKMSEFIKDLIEVFPNDKDFKLAKNSFNLCKLTDEKAPAKLYHDMIKPFKQHILAKNDSFFLTNDYSDIIQNDTDVSTELIIKLKSYWVSLREEKDVVWQYLTLLTRISDKCV